MTDEDQEMGYTDDDMNVIFSAQACGRTMAKAEWNGEAWICSEHGGPDCVASFRNQSLLDELAGGKAYDARQEYPTPEQIEEHKRYLEAGRISHVWELWIEQELDRDQWEKMTNRIDRLLARLGIRAIAAGGPIPGA